MNFAELFFPKGFLEKKKTIVDYTQPKSITPTNKENTKTDFTEKSDRNGSPGPSSSSNFDFLSQLNDKKIKQNSNVHKTHNKHSKKHKETKCDQAAHASENMTPVQKSDHLDILIAASDKLIENGILEETERTIKSLSSDTSVNSESDISLLNKKRIKKLSTNKCQNQGCENKEKDPKLCKVNKNSHANANCPFEWLCKKCYQALQDKHFCYYCFFIYTTETNDNRSWVQCDFCTLWHHVACEENQGKYKNISKTKQKYKCPHCRVNAPARKRKSQASSNVDIYTRTFNYNLKSLKKTPELAVEPQPISTKKCSATTMNHLSLLSSSDYKGIYNDLMKMN